MSYQTLYRKYRPNNFDLVYGQQNIVTALKNAIKNNKISHAYLFSGPRGTGKTTCAKIFAKAVNCLNQQKGNACNKCENCISISNNQSTDIIEIDAASNNGVDEIRELRDKINFVPSSSKYKVYIIDEVHMLSIGAFNALLKTLEEPPEYVIFILATTEINKIPLTILSRCQRFDFKNITHNEMKKCLSNIIEKEQINIEEDAIDEIIYSSNGAMRDGIMLLDQANTYCDNIISKKIIEDLSGSIPDSEIIEFIKLILNRKYKEQLITIENWEKSSKDFNVIINKMIKIIKNNLISKKIKNNKLEIDTSETNMYILLDNFFSMLDIMRKTHDKKSVFEVEIIKISDQISDNVSRETLSTNIKS